MAHRFCMAGLVCLGATLALAQTGTAPSVSLLFASLEEGREILRTRDGFIRRLSPFDRSARLKTDREVSETEFLNFVAGKVIEWDSADRKRVEQAFDRIRPALGEFRLNWPENVHFVHTTGEEEGGAAYTRGKAVILPRTRLDQSPEKLAQLVAHELFHILSRHDRNIRDRLYRVIGFERCPEVELPKPLGRRRITNPDAPVNAHRIRVQQEGRQYWAIPVLYSRSDRYDPLQGGSFFKYLQFRLLLEAVEDETAAASTSAVSPTRLVEVKEVSGFFEQIGRNSSYIIHPEEILAVNFALIVTGETEFPSPEVAERIRSALRAGVDRTVPDGR
ncbi:MAG: hypothetical protein OXU26_04530 [Acidobacteriota bacterium]|nr:hypothetical protein [Acidobacteriota bacterium]MDE2963156.1 hypothetical protein [Acidobacteriota bacterium]